MSLINFSNPNNGNKFVLNLEENALDSLVHAVEHFVYQEKDTDLKFTILHVFHATELFLKARLAKADPKKIFKDEVNGYTVNFPELKKRLNDQGVKLSKQNEDNLEFLRKIRNDIEHYQCNFNSDEIEEYVGRAMYFLDRFLKKELSINLKDKLDQIDEEAYQRLAEACIFYVKRMQEQGISLHPKDKEVDYHFFICESCEKEAVVFPNIDSDDGTCRCFCCQSLYSVKFCLNCDCPIVSLIGKNEILINDPEQNFEEDEEDNEFGWFCDNCQEWIDSRD